MEDTTLVSGNFIVMCVQFTCNEYSLDYIVEAVV